MRYLISYPRVKVFYLITCTTIKVSIELPVATRHCCDMLKKKLNRDFVLVKSVLKFPTLRDYVLNQEKLQFLYKTMHIGILQIAANILEWK